MSTPPKRGPVTYPANHDAVSSDRNEIYRGSGLAVRDRSPT
ncbi:hypothetical protein MNBD_ACTINO02-352, partial [hydrothermal vent metagenome]